MVCGCADPFGERPLGHLSENGIYETWNSEKVKRIRRELNDGHSCFCDPCGLKRFLRDDEPVPQSSEQVEALPRLFFEPTVLCNLACFKAVCHRDSGILNTRTRKLATKIGVDRFTWEIMDHPAEAKSEKYQVGTKYWKKVFDPETLLQRRYMKYRDMGVFSSADGSSFFRPVAERNPFNGYLVFQGGIYKVDEFIRRFRKKKIVSG